MHRGHGRGKLDLTKEVTMQRRVSHLVRDTLLVLSGYATLIAAAWIALGFGGAVIVAIGAGALVALGLPLVFVSFEERELFDPHGRAGR
jgi:hypothetical protein